MKVTFVGPSHRFTSGISYHTIYLANALGKKIELDVVLLRRLLPKFLFPGSKRVGKIVSDLTFNRNIRIYDGIDWYLFPSIFKSLKYFKKSDYIILQWWTSAVAHTYLLISLLNKSFFRKKMIIEFHEIIDPLESKNIFLRLYTKILTRFIFKGCFAYITHSKADKNLLSNSYNLEKSKIHTMLIGGYESLHKKIKVNKNTQKCNILFFGLIRPYKGLKYLVEAYKKLDHSKFSLTIAGEIWEDDTIKKEISSDINFIPRYITDKEVIELFNKADVLVLPYLRASQSGVAHIGTAYGIHLVATPLGGLRESLKGYAGIKFIKPKITEDIISTLQEIYPIRSKRFNNIHTWEESAGKYMEILK